MVCFAVAGIQIQIHIHDMNMIQIAIAIDRAPGDADADAVRRSAQQRHGRSHGARRFVLFYSASADFRGLGGAAFHDTSFFRRHGGDEKVNAARQASPALAHQQLCSLID